MLRRKAEKALAEWKASGANEAVLVTGARQVGKSYLVEEFARQNYSHVTR